MVLDNITIYTITFKAPKIKVWEALTNPTIVKQYFFGTDLITDWTIGSDIIFSGEWEGQAYQDKGKILDYVHDEKLAYSYLSSWSGKEDHPDNYLKVSYIVRALGDETELTITQSNYDEEKAKHSSDNWASLMEEMRKLVE